MKLCNMCPLAAASQVAGSGPKNPKIIVLGDYPNREDEKSGVPFSVNASKPASESANTIIRRLLKQWGYDLENDVYMAYALRCNPFHRSDKVKVGGLHLKACRLANLEPELSEVDCPVILTLGKEPLSSLFPDDDLSVMQARGKWLKTNIGGQERLVRASFSLAQVNKLSLWHVQEGEKSAKLERVQRWNPVGSCGWFFQQDMRAVYDKLQELGLKPNGEHN